MSLAFDSKGAIAVVQGTTTAALSPANCCCRCTTACVPVCMMLPSKQLIVHQTPLSLVQEVAASSSSCCSIGCRMLWASGSSMGLAWCRSVRDYCKDTARNRYAVANMLRYIITGFQSALHSCEVACLKGYESQMVADQMQPAMKAASCSLSGVS